MSIFRAGRAPDALAGLAPPDAIFIGGGASREGVIDAALAALKPGGRLVINAVTLETEALLDRSACAAGRRSHPHRHLPRHAGGRDARLARGDARDAMALPAMTDTPSPFIIGLGFRAEASPESLDAVLGAAIAAAMAKAPGARAATRSRERDGQGQEPCHAHPRRPARASPSLALDAAALAAQAQKRHHPRDARHPPARRREPVRSGSPTRRSGAIRAMGRSPAHRAPHDRRRPDGHGGGRARAFDAEGFPMSVHFIGGSGRAHRISSPCAGAISWRAARSVSMPASLVPPGIIALCPPEARVINTAPMDLDAIEAEYVRAHEAGLDVARLHSGDMSVWSAMGEQLRRLEARGIAYTITTGRARLRRSRSGSGDANSPSRKSPRASSSPAPPGAPRPCRRPRSWRPSPPPARRFAIHLSIHVLDDVVERLIPHYGGRLPRRHRLPCLLAPTSAILRGNAGDDQRDPCRRIRWSARR